MFDIVYSNRCIAYVSVIEIINLDRSRVILSPCDIDYITLKHSQYQVGLHKANRAMDRLQTLILHLYNCRELVTVTYIGPDGTLEPRL